jgi:flagellar motor switch/type III secretory pathway protein FliN
MGERGLLGGLIAAVLHELGTDLSLSLESPPATDGAFRLAIAASTPAGSGELVLEVPPAWLRRATDENRWRRRAAEHLSVVAELRLARTAVPRGMLATVEEGDAVIFDGHESLAGRAQAPWPVALTLGDHQALGVCSADGTITVEGPFRRFRPPSARQLGRDKESTMEPPVSSIDGAAVLAAAPVEVIAELGRLTLRGEEVLALAPGVVIALEAPRPTVISLRVGGEIWAEGELVNVDGELGVRVTSLRRPLTPAER